MNQLEFSVSSDNHKILHEMQYNPSIATHIIQSQESQPHTPRRTVALVVQNTLYPNVTTAVSQYQQDLENSGYDTILYTQPIINHLELKGNLTEWFLYDGLIGAVLIGRFPYAQYYQAGTEDFDPETFICDLYFMDLDGAWLDEISSDDIYDNHKGTFGGDIYPEIFVGRIDPSCLSWGHSLSHHINTYLSKVHNYRIGGIQREQRALVYVDDDWIKPWAQYWSNDVGEAYPLRTLVRYHAETNASDWLNRLSQDYQLGHVCVHSSPVKHYFGPHGSGEGTVSSAQIRKVPPSFNFYNLFSCSGAKWTVTDNLAVTYTFSGNYSLATIGSAKTGSMMDCSYFYAPFGHNATLGESLVHWFKNVLTSNSTAGEDYLHWYYGMAIVGDPMLTLNYDCTVLPPEISSATHPNPAAWYTNSYPQLNWTVPKDVNSITGYYYQIDQYPSTHPTINTSIYTEINGTHVETNLSDGTWYLHVVAKDSAGNIGKKAAHFKFNIDKTSPETTVISPEYYYNSSTDSIDLFWSANDTQSGYAYSQIWMDGSQNLVYNGSLLGTTLTDLTKGLHQITITVFDRANNSASNKIPVYIDLTNPSLSITNPSEGAIIGSVLTIIWEASDNESGYCYAAVHVDGLFHGIVLGPISEAKLTNLDEGNHSLNVTIFDWAGRSTSKTSSITVFHILDFPWLSFLFGFSLTCVVIYIVYHYRQKSG
jgi:hypothetical protein